MGIFGSIHKDGVSLSSVLFLLYGLYVLAGLQSPSSECPSMRAIVTCTGCLCLAGSCSFTFWFSPFPFLPRILCLSFCSIPLFYSSSWSQQLVCLCVSLILLSCLVLVCLLFSYCLLSFSSSCHYLPHPTVIFAGDLFCLSLSLGAFC